MLDRLHRVWLLAVSAAWHRPRLRTLGRRSWIERPLRLAGTRSISVGSFTTIGPGARLETVRRPGKPSGEIVIGDRVSAEQGLHLVACTRVEIDDEVCISRGVTIVDTEHPHGHAGDGNRVLGLAMDDRPVRIGRRAFIGAGAVILRGVSIGENAVVGANSVVTRDVPPDTIVAGAPARVIRAVDDV